LALPYLLAMLVAMVAVPLAWEGVVHRRGARAMGLTVPRRPGRSLLWAVGLLAGFVLYGMLISQVLPPAWRLTPRFEWMVVVSWLVVAVAEECLYRAVVQRRLVGALGPWVGVALAAAVFAFPGHAWAPWQHNLAIRLPFGLMVGGLYLRTESILVPIGVHWVFNCLIAP